MNERIEELVLKAIALDVAETVRVGKANREGDWLFQYSEKFAELIVKECANWIESQDEAEHPTAWLLCDDLKEHFGVEE